MELKNGGAPAPPFLFFLLVVLLPVGILFEGGDWPPATFLIRFSLFLSAAVFLIRRDAIIVRATAPDLLVLGFWAVQAISLVRPGYRWISSQWFLHHTAALCLYGLIRSFRREAEERFARAAGVLILLAAAIQFAPVLYQLLVEGSGRPAGTLANPNSLAELLVYAGVIAWAWREDGNARLRRWLPAVLLSLVAGIAATKSRSGIVLVLAAGAYLAAREVGWKWVAAAAVAAVALLFLVPNPFLGRFVAEGDPFAYERLSMWKAAVRIACDNPLGVGVGHYKYYWHAARDPVAGAIVRFGKSAQTPHAEFFSALSELGIPGAAAFLALGVAGVVSFRRAARSADPLAAGAAMVLFVSYLNSFLQTNYHVIGLLLVNAAALAVISSRCFAPLVEREIRVKGAVRAASLVLLSAMAGYSVLTVAGTVLSGMGYEAARAGRLDEAYRRLALASAADPLRSVYPDSASAVQYRLHESGGGAGHLARAIELEVEASELNPLEYLYPARLAFLYVKAAEGRPGPERGAIFDAALRAGDRAIARNPHSANLRYRQAVLLQDAGRPAASRAQLEAALRDEPLFAKGWAFLGGLLEHDDRPRALDAYRKALGIYRGYGATVREPFEKEFFDFDPAALEKRIRELGGFQKR